MKHTNNLFAIQAKHPSKFEFLWGTGGSSLAVQYQPGDGYRYVIYIADGAGKSFSGAPTEAMLVTVMTGTNQGVSAWLEPETHPSYIREKLKVPETTAHRVAEVLDIVFGSNKTLPV